MDHFFTSVTPDPEPPEAPPPAAPWKQIAWEVVQTLLLSALLFLVINGLSTRIRVQSVSMQPTLYEKDLVLINRLAYQLGKPERRDIVVFNPPLPDTPEPYIKRVIGLPGDTVRVEAGRVYVNGNPLTETYIAAVPRYTGEWVVPPGHLFVLGDNRNNSSDSHSWGMVPLANVLGKAEVLYWPPQHMKWLDPTIAVAAGP